jgi:superfamily II DNA or RNA helicase
LIRLRPDQEDALARADAAYAAGFRAPILVAVTGWGKTTASVEYIRRQIADGRRVWFLAHLDSILNSTADRLAVERIEFGWLWGQKTQNRAAMVQLVSVATAARRLADLPPADLVIIDECDLAIAASYQRVLDALGRPLVLGLTGTPCRADGRPMRDGGFDELIRTAEAQELVDAGILTRPRLWSFPPPLDLARVKKLGDDFDQRAAGSVMSRPKILGDSLEHWLELCREGDRIRPTGAFCSSVDAAEKLAQRWRDAGFRAVAVDGKSSKGARREAEDGLKTGQLDLVATADMWLAGVDIPQIAAILCQRQTMSLRVWLQMLGRGMRTCDEWSDMIILDHVGNARRPGLGTPVDPRMPLWSLDGYKKSPAKNKIIVPTVVICEKCYSTDVNKVTGVCNECGHVRPRLPPGVTVDLEGRLWEVDLDPRKRLKEQMEREKAERMKRQRREESQCQTLADWIALGISRQYKKPQAWAILRFNERQKRRQARAGPVRRSRA